MISFVWSSKYPFITGSGGSESYTAGQIRELQARGIECRIITIGHGKNDGRDHYPDIAFKSIKLKEELSDLDDTIVFVTYPLNVKTKYQSYVILHCPPPAFGYSDPLYDPKGMSGKKLIATSRFAAGLWSRYNFRFTGIKVVYPFADPVFTKIARPEPKKNKTRILFAGRLTPDKGIYTLLAAMHLDAMKNLNYRLTVVAAGAHSEEGAIIKNMLQTHPNIKLVDATRTHAQMAKLMARHDILVMPSTNIFWKESFGILSVEAQHAGCRVVASKAGGLPETNCGGLVGVGADDPMSLADGISKAAKLGPLTQTERSLACSRFTLVKSVDTLLRTIKHPTIPQQTGQPQKAEAPVLLSYPGLS